MAERGMIVSGKLHGIVASRESSASSSPLNRHLARRSAEVGEGNGNRSVSDSKNSVFGLVHAVGSVDETAAGTWVHDPDARNSEGEIFFDSFLHSFHAIFGGEDLNAEQWRLSEYPGVWRGTLEQRNIGDSKTAWLHLNAEFSEHGYAPVLLTVQQVAGDESLSSGMVDFSRISLLYFAVDVIAIRIV
jgi:hypothetical protein